MISYLNELLSSPRIKPFMERLHPSFVFATARGVMDDISEEVRSAATEWRMPDVPDLIEKIVTRLQFVEKEGTGIVLDGTGILFPSRRHAFAMTALTEMIYSLDAPQEVDETMLTTLLCRLTGAEDAVVFASPHLARLAVMRAFGRKHGPSIVIARRDMFEDSAGNRLESLFQLANVRFCETGAANHVTVNDYLTATKRRSGLIYTASGIFSNLVPSLTKDELTQITEKLSEESSQSLIPVLLDVQIAPVVNLTAFFAFSVPTVSDYLKYGYDMILFDGGQLIGGPECGIIIGRKSFIDQIREQKINELFPVHRTDRAGVYKTLSLSMDPEQAVMKIPILQSVAVSVANLRNRAERLIPQLSLSPWIDQVECREGNSFLYAGGSTATTLPACLIEIVPRGLSATAMKRTLESASPGIRGRIDGENYIIDLRTIHPMYDQLIVEIFENREFPAVGNGN